MNSSTESVKVLDLLPFHYAPIAYDCRNVQILSSSYNCVKIKITDQVDLPRDFLTALSELKTLDICHNIEIEFSADEIRDLPHEILLGFSKLRGSNVLLKDIGKPLSKYDMKSPDQIVKEDDKVSVLEVKTHQITAYENEDLSRYLDDVWIYKNVLEQKLDGVIQITYGTVIAFRNMVFFPEWLKDRDWNLLGKLINASWSLQSYIFSHSDLVRPPQTSDERVLYTLRLMKQLEWPQTTDCLHIGEKDLEYLCRPENSKQIRESYKSIMNKAAQMTITRDRVNCETLRETLESLEQGDELQDTKYELDYYDTISKKLEAIGMNPKTHKSVVQHPFCSVKDTKWDLDQVVLKEAIKQSTPETLLWESYLVSHCGQRVSTELPLDLLKLDLEHVYAEKSSRFIVNFKLKAQDKLILATKGVRGKIFKHTETKKEVTQNSKKIYGLNAYTTDIDHCVEDLLSPALGWLEPTDSNEELLDILETDFKEEEQKFCSIHESTSLMSVRNMLFKSKLFRALRVLELIVMEVNYSRQTNLKSDDDYIVKKVPNVDMYVMIVPTRADRHIFYSVLMPKSSVEKCAPEPFKQMIDIGDFLCSEFVSLDQDRISHLLSCSHKLMGIFIQKLQTNFPSHINNIVLSKEWRDECATSLLIYLEDKAQTSAALLNIRYAYMDLLSAPETMSHPLKVLNKMPTIIRSRLLVWIINRFISAFKKMYSLKLQNPMAFEAFRDSDPKVAQDKVKNMISWVTGCPLTNISHMLDLSYLGHLHNKDEGDVTHGNSQIYNKVIQEECYVRLCDPMVISGCEDPPDPSAVKSHEFSKTVVSIMSAMLKRQLLKLIKERCPNRPEDLDPMEWYIASRLSKLKMEALVTTKASAWNIKSNQKYEEGEEEGEVRRKVYAALYATFADKTIKSVNVVEAAIQALDTIKGRESKGVLVNLFKKLQLGGVREIFVLTILDRITIFIVETISRCLCELLDNEMLTKGDAKIIRSDDHMRKVHALSEGKSVYQITGTSSADATTWCQRFTMKIFGRFLLGVLPPAFHCYVATILNNITNKQLQLPLSLLRLWKKYPTTESTSPYLNELKRQFLNSAGEHDLIECGSRMMKNRSNFMQGILHYTSSLLHSAYLTMMTNILTLDYKSQRFQGVITTKCSSDDSSVIITLIDSDKERLESLGVKFIRRALLFINDCYWVFGAKASLEKSTVAVMDLVEEFNSTWLVRNTVVVPLIKYVAAAFRTPPFIRLDSTLRQYASMRSQLISCGASFSLTAIIQREQAIHHYKSLGLFSHDSGAEVYLLIKRTQSPYLGYFIFEPVIMTGLLGFEFAYYLFLRMDPDRISNHDKFYRLRTGTLDSSLEYRSMVTLGPGKLMKYLKSCEQVDLDRQKVNEYFNSNPHKLLDDWHTLEDAIMGIRLKVSEIGVSESFSGTKDSTTFNRAVYFNSSKCLTERQWAEEGSKHKHTFMHLLMKYTASQTTEESRPIGNVNSSWKSGFVLHEFYDEIIRVLIEEGQSEYQSSKDKRRMLVSRSLKTYEGGKISTLKTCAAMQWFNLAPDSVVKQADIEQSWNQYKLVLPWLRNTFEETMKESVFDNPLELIDFIKAYSHKSKTMTVLCPMRTNVSAEVFIRKAIRWNQWPLSKLKACKQVPTQPQVYNLDDSVTSVQIISTVSNVCNLPPMIVRDKSTGLEDDLRVISLKKLAFTPEMINRYDTKQFLDREAAECLKCLRFYYDVEREKTPSSRQRALERALQTYGSQYVHYVQRQRHSTAGWFGPLNMDLIVSGVKMNVRAEDSVLIGIRMQNCSKFVSVKEQVCKVLIEHGILTSRCHPEESKIYFDLNTGQKTQVRTSTSIPLIQDDLIDQRIKLPADPSLIFQPEEYALKLVEKSSNTTLAICRLQRSGSFQRAKAELINHCFENLNLNSFIKDCLTCFCLNEPLPGGESQQLLQALSDDSISENGKILKCWLKNLIEIRLRRKGFLTGVKQHMLSDLTPVDADPDIDPDDPSLLYIFDSVPDSTEMLIEQLVKLQGKSASSGTGNDDSDSDLGGQQLSPDSFFDLNDEVYQGQYLATDLFDFLPKSEQMVRDPAFLMEKTWIDAALHAINSLKPIDSMKLVSGELQENLATEDVKILAKFMNWRLVGRRGGRKFSMTE